MYIIKKDGLYLMGYKPSGLTEYDKNGKPQEVYTGIWGTDKHDAIPFDNKAFVEIFAGMIGGQVIKVAMKE